MKPPQSPNSLARKHESGVDPVCHCPPTVTHRQQDPPLPTIDKAATSLPTHCTHGRQGRHITAPSLHPRSTRLPHHCPPAVTHRVSKSSPKDLERLETGL